MKKIAIIILGLLATVSGFSQCPGVSATGTTKAKVFKSCYDTVVVGSSLNTVVADTFTCTKATITNLTDGLVKSVSDVLTPAVSGTDYAPATSGTSILKGNGSGGFSSAVAGVNGDYITPSSIGGIVAEADATNFVTGASAQYFKNRAYVGTLVNWDFTNGTTGWSCSGSGTTWALNGSYLQASGGGGASDYTNIYRYDYQFSFAGQQVEINNFIPTVNATNAGEGLGIGVKTNDGIYDLMAKIDLSATGTRGQLKIYSVVSGTATLLATSSSNLSFTTNTDVLSLKLIKRVDGFIEAKVVNNTTSLSVSTTPVAYTATENRQSKIAIYHFGGTQKIANPKLKNTSPKSKKTLLFGDSITNGYSTGFITSVKGDAYRCAAAGGSTTDAVNSIDAFINSGATNVIIMIGMNDAGASVSTSDYMINLRKIVNAFVESGMTPILCYVTPAANSTRNSFIIGYNAAILSEYTGIYTIIDTFSPISSDGTLTGTLNASYDSGDGVHPNAAGYLLINSTIQHATVNYIYSNAAIITETQTYTGDNIYSGAPTFSGNVLFRPGAYGFGSNGAISSTDKLFNVVHTNSIQGTKYGMYMDFTSSYSATPSGSGRALLTRNTLTGSQNYSGLVHIGTTIQAFNSATSTSGNALGTMQALNVFCNNTSTGTVTNMIGIDVPTYSNGGGGSVGTTYGIYLEDQTVGTANFGLRSFMSSGSGKWSIFSGGTANNAFAGNTIIGASSTPNSTLQISGSMAPAYVAKTGAYSIASTDYTIDCTSGTFTVTLPTAASITGRVYVISNTGAGTITLATTSSQTINGSTTQTIAAGGGYSVQSNGTNWTCIGKW